MNNCQTCGRFTEHKKKVFGKDGICRLIVKKPTSVKKNYSCKYWIERKA